MYSFFPFWVLYVFISLSLTPFVEKKIRSLFFFFFRSNRIKMIVNQILLGILGVIASLYSFYVKKQHEKNPKYKAICDLGPNASCSRVLTSE